MKSRIGLWAAAGSLVVVFWTLYISATSIDPQGLARVLVDLTCPIELARTHPMAIDLILLVNAATYAFIGLVVEITLHPFREAA